MPEPYLDLFLDLDATCLHSIAAENTDEVRMYLQWYRAHAPDEGGPQHFPVGWDEDLRRPVYQTFVRPGLLNFLRRLSPDVCRLHVWTAGTREYAEEIVEKLFTARRIPITQIFHRDHCDWSEAVHGHPKRLRTVREWHPLVSADGSRLAPAVVLLDDRPEMARGQENCVVVVPAFEVHNAHADVFFLDAARVWGQILECARVQHRG